MVTSKDMQGAAGTQGAGNIYEFNANQMLEVFAPFVDGDANCLLAVVSSGDVGDAARSALEASAAKLGFGRGRIAWVTISAEGAALGARELEMLLEGVDPVAIVVCDGDAASVVSRAFDVALRMDAVNRARCRTVVAFSDFGAMLGDDGEKQKAWFLLKQVA